MTDSLREGTLFQKPKAPTATRTAPTGDPGLRETGRELSALRLEIASARRSVTGAQNYLRTLLGPALPGLHEWSSDRADPGGVAAEVLAADVRSYRQLAALGGDLDGLEVNNNRLRMVVDLMGAADKMLEPATRELATTFLNAHVSQCRAMLQQVRDMLQDFPRLGPHRLPATMPS